ncbi:MAG: hypothetical protein U5K43_01660 [Halofilum sp. (in: g-proteobacteria)]|nr:hypothetical protein [Halofilum sp. (in: g-proteobacteria)]
MEVWQGDFFDLSTTELKCCDALWDRAALIALPAALRAAYVAHCAALLAPGARGLLVTLDYDPAEHDGPPFAVPPQEVEALYAPYFEIEGLVAPHAVEPSPHLRERGLRTVREAVWRVTRRSDVRVNGSDA